MRRRTDMACFVTSKPTTDARPLVSGKSVVKILMIVLLPAPLGPSKPKTSPWFTEKLTMSTAVWSPKLLTRSATSIIGEDCVIALLLLSSNSCHYGGKRLTRSLQKALKQMLQHRLLI